LTFYKSYRIYRVFSVSTDLSYKNDVYKFNRTLRDVMLGVTHYNLLIITLLLSAFGKQYGT